MAGQLTMEKYPDKISRVIYLDKDSKKKFVFFTNALTISPVMLTELYHNRWQIELFFKWIKIIIVQNLYLTAMIQQKLSHDLHIVTNLSRQSHIFINFTTHIH